MTDECKTAFQASINAKIIRSLCDLYRLPVKEATDIYYQSETSELRACLKINVNGRAVRHQADFRLR